MADDPQVDYDALAAQARQGKTAASPKPSGAIDYDALASQARQAKPTTPQATPDLTANPKGEGLYRMGSYDFHEGGVSKPEVQIPYSRVKDAQAAGYKLHPDEKSRYEKDSTHEGQGPGFLERTMNSVNKALEPVPGERSIPITGTPLDDANTVRAAGRTILAAPGYLRDLLGAATDMVQGKSTGQELLDMIDPTKIPEGMYKQFKEDYKQDPKMAADNLAGSLIGLGITHALTHGAGEAARAVGGKVMDSAPEAFRKTAQTVVGAGERDVKAHVTDVADKANTDRDTTLDANKKADEATLEARGKVEEANHQKALADDLARAEAEEKTLKARGVVDEANKKAVDAHADAVREAEEKTLKARGLVDDANKAARLKAKAESVGAEKASNADEPFLEGENVETSARQEHDATVKRQQDVEAKRTKLTVDEAHARQNITQRVQAIYQAAKDYFKQGFEDVTAKLDAPDPDTGQVHTVPYADLDEMVDEAEGKIKGSRANVSIFNDIGKKAGGVAEGPEKIFPSKAGEPELAPDEVEALKRMSSAGDELPGAKYSDLDGYYQEAGRVIGNPATAPDVRQAVVKFRQMLGERMQELANDVDPATAKKHALLRRQYKEYAGGYRNYSGPGGSGSPVAMGLQAQDPYNATRPYEGLEPEEAKRVEKIVTGDSAKPETQFTGKTIVGPDGKEVPAWRFRKQTHAAINDLRNIQKGLDSLPKPEKLAKEVETSAGKLADARAKARETAGAKPDQKEYPQPVATPPVPTPKPYPEPEPTPPVTPPKEYGEPSATKPVEVPKLNTQKIRDDLITEKLKQWTRVNKYDIVRLVAAPIGVVVGAATGHLSWEIGSGVVTAASMTPFALQKLLDHPGVREWFTKPPAGEIEALRNVPHADRVRIADTFRQVVKQADKDGKPIKLAPAVVTFMAANRGPKKDDSDSDLKKKIADMHQQIDELAGAVQ